MREILFRGKEIATRKWVYGGFTLDAINNPRIVEADGDGCLSHKVDPDTVGQYTGLNDKNGVKMFEGDIIEYFNTQTNGGYRTMIVFKNGAFLGDNLGKYDLETREWRVIGNIHDNRIGGMGCM